MGTEAAASYGGDQVVYRWLGQVMAMSRQGYKRLIKVGGQPKRRVRVRVARLGGGGGGGGSGSGSNKYFKIKLRRLRWRSPLSLFTKIRDAYVSLLLSASSKLSSTESLSFGPSFYYAKSTPFSSPPPKHYDKFLLELYMSMAQLQLTSSF